MRPPCGGWSPGGAEVTILDFNAEKGEALAKELGGATKFFKADVTNAEQVAEGVAMASESAPLRVGINCAGTGHRGTHDQQGRHAAHAQ